MNISKALRRIFNFITFTDIPIWQKLLTFAAGGIAWFIIIALIGLGAATYVNDYSKALTNEIVPQTQASQKLVIKIRGANVSVHRIAIHNDIEMVNKNVKRAKDLLSQVTVMLRSLLEGGRIKDYSDLTGELIEEFQVAPIRKDSLCEKYIKEVSVKNQSIRETLDKLASVKLMGLERGGLSQEDRDLFVNKLKEYDTLTVQSVMLLGKLTSRISALQKQHTEKINTVLRQSMIVFIFVGILAVLLLIVFSHFLKASMTKPIKKITEQIKGLSEGEVDLTKQITVGSKDEIAELSANFNILMQTIHDMNTFKKVIEEDDSLQDVYTRLAKVFHEGLGLDDISVYEVSSMNKNMQLINSPYSREEVCCNREILIDSDLCRARKTGHIVSSITYPEICKQFLLAPEKYHICIPMIIGGTTGGVIQFQFDKTSDEARQKVSPVIQVSCIERQVLKAEQYIKESSAVIEAKRLTSALKESSVKDQLTGLYNRRFLDEYAETLIAGVMRKGNMLALLMCDLDFFKEVNDKYGHAAGDMVLKEAARVIANNARTSDLVVRFGGEEFVVIAYDAKEGDAKEIAERIRKKIEGTKIKASGGLIQKTISIGYSEFPKDTQNFWESIKYADIAMYKAKETGRNRVVRFEREMWTKKEY